MVEALNKDTFEYKVNSGVVLVDFWATWCGPCQVQGPIIDELADEIQDVHFYKVDVDENQELAAQFQVMSIPTLMTFKDGELKDRLVGVHQKDQLMDILSNYR